MSKDFTGFSSENLSRMLAEWGADQREREAWKDRDASTYRFRANLLEASSQRIAALQSRIDALTADAERLDFIRPGFKVLAGGHILQVWWMKTLPNGKKESRMCSVPIETPDALRVAIDNAMEAE